MRATLIACALAGLALPIATADSQPAATPAAATAAPSYADLADLALAAPIAAHVRVASATRIRGEAAAAVAPGKTRLLVEAEVVSLIKGSRGIPPTVRYLVDLPNPAAGGAAKIARKSEQLIFAAPVAGRAGEVQLIAPDAQFAYSAERGGAVRAVLTEAAQADAPPAIRGIGRAFHVPGSIPGESETQIFLQAADGRPISLNILRRPGQQPRWAVALSEIVDEAAAAPRPGTLLWYRLACTLPAALPRPSFAEASAAEAAAIRADYAVVLDRLGPCARSRRRG